MACATVPRSPGRTPATIRRTSPEASWSCRKAPTRSPPWCVCAARRDAPWYPRADSPAWSAAAPRKPATCCSLRRLNRIHRLDAASQTLDLDAGVTLEQAQALAAEAGLDPGIDLAARGSASVGGLVATNAGGIRAFRFGTMRQRVLGLEAVLADGSVYSDLRGLLKNTTGYDLKQLFVGAEGTLGIVTRAVLRLEPLQRPAPPPC